MSKRMQPFVVPAVLLCAPAFVRGQEGHPPVEAVLYRIEGTVKLRGVLRASGRVKEISVVEGLPHGLKEKAVRAFRHLRFLPARDDGRRVSQWFTAEYAFALD